LEAILVPLELLLPPREFEKLICGAEGFDATFMELLFLKSKLSFPDKVDGIELVKLVNTSFISFPKLLFVMVENPKLFDFSNFTSPDNDKRSSITFSFVVWEESSIDISFLSLEGLKLDCVDVSPTAVSSSIYDDYFSMAISLGCAYNYVIIFACLAYSS